MYDTITIWLEAKDTDRAINEIQNSNDRINTTTGEVINTTGFLENLRVKINYRGISINGSLAKYHLGNNLKTLTRKDSQSAIEKLSDKLSLPLDQAKVCRLDLGCNILVNKPLINYYDCLGDMNYFKKTSFDNDTVLYTNGKNGFEFYNKVKKMRKKREPIPDIFKNKTILRIESHLNKRIGQTLKEPEIKVSFLFDERFYIKVIDLFKKQYDSINKIKILKLNPEVLKMAGVKEFLNMLALLSIKNLGGEKEMLKMLEMEKNNLEKMQYTRLRNKIKQLANQPELTEPNESITELNRKVKQALANYR